MSLAGVAQDQPVTVDAGISNYLILAIYFLFVIAVGLSLRRKMRSSEDFFVSGRAMPSWVTGFVFLAANLGALEVMGFGAGAAQYGLMMAHFYWVRKSRRCCSSGW